MSFGEGEVRVVQGARWQDYLHRPAGLPHVRCHQPRGAFVDGACSGAGAKEWGVAGRGHSLGASRVDGRRCGR